MNMSAKKASTTRHTFIVMLFTFISRILGFVRTAVIAYLFGANRISDVLNLTFNVPNNLRKLMAEGAFSSAFIPVFNQSLVQDPERKKTQGLVNKVITFQLVVLIPFCLLCIVCARLIIAKVITEFSNEEQIALSISLFRWFIFYLLFISLSAVVMGILNTHRNFAVPALTPILFSVCVIGSLLVFYKSFGVFSMVIGVLAGGIAQLIFQLPWLRKEGYKIRLDFTFRDSEFVSILKRWVPVLATSSVFTITQFVAQRFASGLEESSTTALLNSIVIFQLPYGLFFASVSTVLFPKMSRQFAENDYAGLRDTLQYGIRFLFALLLPSMIVLYFMGYELSSVLLQGGEFTLEASLLTGWALQGYTYGLFALGIFNFLQRFFYSANNYRIPFIGTLIVGSLDVVLSLILKETPLKVMGLSLANSISFFAGMIYLLVMARKKAGGLNIRKILISLAKIVVSCAVLALFFVLSDRLFTDYWFSGRTLKNLCILGLKGIAGTLIIYLFYRILKVEMFRRKNE
ncbi:MAG: murein biosynthesis integral membrane protein MurJ [Spirochaetales bacterium]|nr:murein biosynthesis integral membrane protein MurJ [Spirochaetales bacterium]